MRRFRIVALSTTALCAVGLGALCLTWATSALADTTSPGKNAVFVSASNLSLPTSGTATLLTGQITKGKKKTVLAIEAMLTSIGQFSGPRTDTISPTVNGITVEPASSALALVNCPTISSTSFACTVTGTWWLDIDAAEAAHAGMFVGQPLNITLTGSEIGGVGDSGLIATLTARVQKK